MNIKFVGTVDEIIINKLKKLLEKRSCEFYCHTANCIIENRKLEDKNFIQIRKSHNDGSRYMGFMKWYSLPDGRYRVYVIPSYDHGFSTWDKLFSTMESFRKIEEIVQNVINAFPTQLLLTSPEYKREREEEELFNVIVRRMNEDDTGKKTKWLYGKANKFLEYIHNELGLIRKAA